jgi:Spy/CpxP family protein refolding chaperone
MAGERTKTAALALVLAVFVLGVAIGGLGMYLERNHVLGAGAQQQADHSPAAVRARRVEQMTHELSLTPDQQQKLDAILAQTMAQYAAIRDQATKMTQPQMEQTRNQGRDQIRGILTPEQLPKFEDFLRRIDEDRKKRSSN